MIPYATPLFFGVVGYAAVPLLLLGLRGRLRGTAILVVSLALTALQLGWNGELASGVGGLALQLAVVVAYPALRRRAVRGAHWGAIALVLLPLVMTRLTGVTSLTSPFGFLGISYVTFRALDVVFGIKDGNIKEIDSAALVAYLLFFPTLSSGPIDRYRRFAADFRRTLTRDAYVDLLESAVPLLIRGMLYKFVLAALVKEQLLDRLNDRGDLLGVGGYMYAYTAFPFLDFAGYSAMAVALSRLFGISTPQNFDRPFVATNIVEFWNRWHMSLSTWFRDHVYMRIVLAAKRGKWFSDRHLPSYLALTVSFGLMGVWHGWAWHFVVYGIYHALLQIGHSLFTRWNATHRVWGEGPGWRFLGRFLTTHAFCFGLLLFSGRLF